MTQQSSENFAGTVRRSLGLGVLAAFEFANGSTSWLLALGVYKSGWGSGALQASLFLFLLGATLFASSYSIWNGKRWGWPLTLILNAFGILSAATLLITVHFGILLGFVANVAIISTGLGVGLFFMALGLPFRIGPDLFVPGFSVVNLSILWFLSRRSTRAYFGKREAMGL